MKLFLAALTGAIVLHSSLAHSDPAIGFAITDVRQISTAPLVIGTNRYSRSIKPGSLTFRCRNCRGTQSIDIRIERASDDTEAQLRSGQLTAVALEARCKSRYPDCKVEALELNGAIGTISRQNIDPISLSNGLLYKNGDKLIIQALAPTPQIAFDTVKAAKEQLAPLIIGQN